MHIVYLSGDGQWNKRRGITSEVISRDLGAARRRLQELSGREDVIIQVEGGADVDPTGEVDAPTVHPRVYIEPNRYSHVNRTRDHHEMHLIYAAVQLGIPIFAFCRGHQLLNVVMGGTLYQDLDLDKAPAGRHATFHPVVLDDTIWSPSYRAMMLRTNPFQVRAWKPGQIIVNNTHHQAVKQPGPSAQVLARHPEGVVETIIYQDILAASTQHHPEYGDHFELLFYFADLLGVEVPEDNGLLDEELPPPHPTLVRG